MVERLTNYRRERIASLESGEAIPLPPEIEEGGLVEPQYPSWFPREAKGYPLNPNRSVVFPYEAQTVNHFEQRREMRRITRNGKRS